MEFVLACIFMCWNTSLEILGHIYIARFGHQCNKLPTQWAALFTTPIKLPFAIQEQPKSPHAEWCCHAQT
jgi:hypothetical protein